MNRKLTAKLLCLLLIVGGGFLAANAQTAEVSVTLDEQFFDALLDAVFKNFPAPEFPLAKNDAPSINQNPPSAMTSFAGKAANRKPVCRESVRLLRQIGDARTAVRFRDGKIYAPLAFAGSYNPPLLGCVEFQGYAETNITLEYDRQSGKLFGRVRVLSVNLGGLTSLASGVLARLVQASIDKKINPIEILQIDKLSFLVPIQNADGALRMKANGVRPEILNGALRVNVTYEFSKN